MDEAEPALASFERAAAFLSSFLSFYELAVTLPEFPLELITTANI